MAWGYVLAHLSISHGAYMAESHHDTSGQNSWFMWNLSNHIKFLSWDSVRGKAIEGASIYFQMVEESADRQKSPTDRQITGPLQRTYRFVWKVSNFLENWNLIFRIMRFDAGGGCWRRKYDTRHNSRMQSRKVDLYSHINPPFLATEAITPGNIYILGSLKECTGPQCAARFPVECDFSKQLQLRTILIPKPWCQLNIFAIEYKFEADV